MKFWIKERDNGQSEPYFVACGKLSKKVAKLKGDTLCGVNTMHSFDTKKKYNARLTELRAQGSLIQ